MVALHVQASEGPDVNPAVGATSFAALLGLQHEHTSRIFDMTHTDGQVQPGNGDSTAESIYGSGSEAG